MKKHWIAFLLLLSLTITSCTPKPSAALDDTSCQAPCWRNISMGMKKDVVISLLSKMSDINQNTVRIADTLKSFWDEGVEWNFIDRQESSGGIYFHEGKVVIISFDFNQAEPLANLIKKYTQPSQVWARVLVLDTSAIDISFMYPDKGICSDMQIPGFLLFQNKDTYLVRGSTPIRDVYYFDPSVSMEKYDIDCIWQIDKSLIQPWKGYGNYAVYQAK